MKSGFLNDNCTLFQSTVLTADNKIGVDDPDGLVATEETGVDSLFVRLVLETLRLTMLNFKH